MSKTVMRRLAAAESRPQWSAFRLTRCNQRTGASHTIPRTLRDEELSKNFRRITRSKAEYARWLQESSKMTLSNVAFRAMHPEKL
jgi:hypothetical protein